MKKCLIKITNSTPLDCGKKKFTGRENTYFKNISEWMHICMQMQKETCIFSGKFDAQHRQTHKTSLRTNIHN